MALSPKGDGLCSGSSRPKLTTNSRSATAGLPGLRSLANSAGVLCWPAARRDWARCGIALYGADPQGENPSGDALHPVMKARSEIIAVRDVADRATRVGLVAFG